MKSTNTIPALTGLLAICLSVIAVGQAPEEIEPEITISKETTFVTKPLNKDGTVDFSGALNLHYGKGVTAKNNANVLFWRAMGPHPENATMPPEFFMLMGIQSPPENGEYLLHLSSFLQRRYGNIPAGQRDLFYKQQGFAQSQPWSKADFPEIAAWLAANEKPLKLIVEGTKRSRYFSPMVVPEDKKKSHGLVAVTLPAIQNSRSVARMLTARAMRHVKSGNNDAAWNDLIACHRLARQIGAGPTLIEGLVGYAIGAITSESTVSFLSYSRITAKQIARYRREFAGLRPMPRTAERVNYTERLMFLDSVMLLAYGGPETVDRVFELGGGALPKLLSVDFGKLDWNLMLKTGNRWYDRLYAATSIPNRPAREKAMRAVDREIRKLTAARNAGKPKNPREASKQIGRALVVQLAPASSQAQSAEDRFEQRRRNISVGLALTAFRVEHGRYPGKLPELTPKLLKSLPADLFTGRGLKYRRNKNGYLLYSFGPNEMDDGGKTFGDANGTDDLRIAIPEPPQK